MRTARLLTATTLCWISLLCLGCGDDESPVPSDDGVDEHTHDAQVVDLGSIEDELDGLHETDDQLGGDLDELANGLANGLADAGAAIDALDERVDELDDRITALEPCEGDECTTEDVTEQLRELFRPIIVATCEDVVECCSSGQLKVAFGPAFDSVEDCVALQDEWLDRGTPDALTVFTSYSADTHLIPALVAGGIEMLDDPSLVQACVEHIRDNACGVREEIDECDYDAWSQYQQDPCAMTRFFRGKRAFGERCGYQGTGACQEGLRCNSDDYCERVAVEGDACAHDYDCGVIEYDHYQSGLHCNMNMGRCEPFRKLGDACETLLASPPYARDDDPVECGAGLFCHPEDQVCVSSCSEGARCLERSVCEGSGCTITVDYCGADLICAEEYWGEQGRGTCREPFALGAPCVSSAECESGRCEHDVEDDREECVPALKADGSACTLDTEGVGQSDSTCSSGWCASDGECAASCSEATCANDRVCLETEVDWICEVPVETGDECVTPLGGTPDDGCASGYCDEGTCAATADEDGECASLRHEQCPAAQYCDEGTCADRIASGQACEGGGDERCAVGFECVQIGEASACHPTGAYPNGASCSDDSSCSSGWCDLELGTCRAMLTEGEACIHGGSFYCEEGLDCIGATCVAAPLTCPVYYY